MMSAWLLSHAFDQSCSHIKPAVKEYKLGFSTSTSASYRRSHLDDSFLYNAALTACPDEQAVTQTVYAAAVDLAAASAWFEGCVTHR